MRVDSREGSKELIAPLRAAGLTVESCILDSGDVEILGNGPEGFVLVGVEYKTVPDTLASLRSGRLADQLRRMRQDYNLSWLLVEGEYRSVGSKWDSLQTKHGAKWHTEPGHYSVGELEGGLLTMCQCSGVLLWFTKDRQASVRWLKSLDRWWTVKDYEEHRSHLEWYHPDIPHNPFGKEPPLVQKVAYVLPHIGAKKARAAAGYFKSVKKMVDANVTEWYNVEGVGEKIAKAVVEAVEKEE